MNEQYRGDLSAAFSSFMSKVYGWMFLGLLITAFTSYIAFQNDFLVSFGQGIYILFIVEFILVISISSRVQKMNPSVTALLFLIYSLINGLTLSYIFYIASMETIYLTFIVTSLTFGVMSLYGYFTKTDLTGVGKVLHFLLIGLIIMYIVNMFARDAQLNYGLTIIGLLVFWGLTAYDTQKLKSFFMYSHERSPELENNFALVGALTLYLDFVNIFIFLLRIFSRD